MTVYEVVYKYYSVGQWENLSLGLFTTLDAAMAVEKKAQKLCFYHDYIDVVERTLDELDCKGTPAPESYKRTLNEED